MKLNPYSLILLLSFASLQTFVASNTANSDERPPNFVIIFLDDSGWGDFHPFGNPKYKTPHVQRLAKEGTQFNNFYVPQAVCSASRAALLTGCYPGRTKVFGAHPPKAKGLDPKFATLAEVLKKKGYATCFTGKWHVGDQEATRPQARGFDESSGLMYSNDMWEFHPENPKYWGKFPLKYWKNGKVTIERVTKKHQPYLTTWSTEHAVDFIKRKKDQPFFVYVPHSMPHVPLFVSEKFAGKSGQGLYGDVMMEIDWSVGEIMKALEKNGVEKNTLVAFTSDNGPWISYGNHAGTTPFREAKGTSFDGGIRSACIIKLPGKIPAGHISTRAFSSIDFLPTFSSLAQAQLPSNPVDGKDVWSIITGQKNAKNPHSYYPFSNGRRFEGIISGDGIWKLHIPHRYRTLVQPAHDGQAGKYKSMNVELSLFKLDEDPLESENVLKKHPEQAEKMLQMAEKHKKTFYPKQK